MYLVYYTVHNYVATFVTEQWSNEGVLELRTAFSRDQNCKIYVQDLIVEDAKHLWNLLQVIIIPVQCMLVPL